MLSPGCKWLVHVTAHPSPKSNFCSPAGCGSKQSSEFSRHWDQHRVFALNINTNIKGIMGRMLLKRLEAVMHKKTCILRGCPSVLVCHLRAIIVCPSCCYLLTSLVRLMFCTQIDIMMMKVLKIMMLLLLMVVMMVMLTVMMMMVVMLMVMIWWWWWWNCPNLLD